MDTNKLFAWYKDKAFADSETETAYQLKNAKTASLFMRVVWIPVLISVTALVIRDVLTAPKGSFGDLSTLLRLVILLITFGLLWASKIPNFQKPSFVRTTSDLWTLAVFIIILIIAFSRSFDSVQDYYRTIISFLITVPIVGVFYRQPFRRVALIFGGAWIALSLAYLPLAKINLEAYLSGQIAIFAITVLSGTLTTVIEDIGREAFLANRKNELQTIKIAEESKRKTDFLAALSHDLRQPLTGLIGYLELAKRVTSRESSNREVDDYITHAQRGANAIQMNLVRVLELARLEDYQSIHSPAPVSLNQTFKLLGSMFEAKAHIDQIKLKIIVDPDPGIYVNSDPDLLFQILQNLIANSISYRRKSKSNSWILLTSIRLDNNRIRISVIDNGIGISKHNQQKVFEPYFQIANSSRNSAQGVGLGLAFVDRAVKKLNEHKLVMESNGSTYTRFNLYMPQTSPLINKELTQPLDKHGLKEVINPACLQGIKILIIEDDEEIRKLLAQFLNAYGAATFQVSGFDQFYMLRENARVPRPTLIVTDHNLEGSVNGVEAVQKIRSFYQIDIPAILITARVGLSVETTKSVQAIVHKPFELQKIVDTILEILSQFKQKTL